MPCKTTPHCDTRPDLNLFAKWVDSDDHFGVASSASFNPSGRNKNVRTGSQPPAVHRSNQGIAPSQASANAPETSPAATDSPASNLTADNNAPQQQPTSTALPDVSIAPVLEPDLPAPAPASTPDLVPAPAAAPAPASLASSQSQPRRTRAQVGRDSYQLLWREYLALTAESDQQQQQRRPQQQPRIDRRRSANGSAVDPITPPAILDLSPSTHPLPPAGPPPARPPPADSTPTQMAHHSASPSTLMQGPLSYDKPKGAAAVLLPLLCPPVDFINTRLLTRHLMHGVLRACELILRASVVLVPIWLWLVRHELLIGHWGDAVLVLVGGALLFLAADAIPTAAARAAAERRAGVFTARDRKAYQIPPGMCVTDSSGPGSSAAATAAATAPASSSCQPAAAAANLSTPAPAPQVVGSTAQQQQRTAAAPAAAAPSVPASSTTTAAAAAAGPRNQPHPGHQGHHPTPAAPGQQLPAASASASDPQIRKVKQRIIRLEQLLFGNELTEADISRDALHSRVQTLCAEVGVPYGGPGGSSSRPTASDLDLQLQAVEQALGVQ